MSLTDILYDALDDVDGARFAGVVGTDGLRVEMVFDDEEQEEEEFDLELAELELATIAAMTNAASGRIGSGRVLDLTIETEELVYLAALITPGYFAVLGLYADGEVEQARVIMDDLLERLREEL
ncbi:MAG: hypothetical protein EI684_01525 [Candidatus Viridilinea halotolerans]|uniref:Roadblock/LC7 domain-containing protein n=1 Tax=Candidatus Viridilinea halotolerans TaxID=2491704 RepID=A0A426UAI6_9CHLR|nr:MAG: hypothetical protein EI684_01525 [Candidatus Viridilinea halotolerans]